MIWAWSSTAWADAAQTRRPCGFSNLAVELYAQGGVIRPDLTDAMFSSPARTTTSGTAEQDFSARGSDIGFNTPWMPIIEGGAIVFPCRFFGIGVHGGGSWSGVPDGQPVSTQLAQRTASQITMMRMALSLHGQLPISRYFLLRASALVGYRSYGLPVSGTGQREALVEQLSVEPRLEARLRLPVGVPFGIAAFVGGEVASQPALTFGGGLFLATDWPDAIRRSQPTPPVKEEPVTPPSGSLQSPLDPPLATPVPSPIVAPVTPPVAPMPAPVVMPVTPPVTLPVTLVNPPAPVVTPPVPEGLSPVPPTPIAPVDPPPVVPVTPISPPVESPPPPAVVGGVAFMDQTGTGVVSTAGDVLNVRGAPARTAAIVGTVPKGSRVTITGVAPGWYRIRFRDGIAYVSADFITREN
jgi:hypothetical protein